MFIGEIMSVGVAISWTFTALIVEYASRRIGSPSTNFIRLTLAFLLTGVVVLVGTGCFLAPSADYKTWFWISLSGLVGYFMGDFCLFYSYTVIGSRFGQLFMTLAPPVAAFAGYFVLGERISWLGLVGMCVTLAGISMSIFGRHGLHFSIKLPMRGILAGIGSGVGQGLGLVFSKLGMEYYGQSAGNSVSVNMIPFAASQMRMVIAIICFGLLLLLIKKQNHVSVAFHESKVAWSVILGTIFGPFLGVAFSLVALQYTASGIASTLMALSPIMIILPAALIYKQKVTVMEVVGAVVSVAGASLFFL